MGVPYWVNELKDKHKNDILLQYISAIFLFIFLLLLLFAFPLAFLPSPDSIYTSIIALTIFIGLFTSTWFLLKNHYNYLNIDCLAYYLYKTGSGFNNFTDSEHYFKTNQVFIKKMMNIINHHKTYKRSVFSDNITHFFSKLEQICLRLNYLYSKECDHTTYAEHKRKISQDIIKLGNLIKKEQSFLSPTHLETIDNILQVSADVPEKQIESYTPKINISQPYILKVFEFSIITFAFLFFGSKKLMDYFLNPDSISNDAIMVFSGTILAALLTQINHIIKK